MKQLWYRFINWLGNRRIRVRAERGKIVKRLQKEVKRLIKIIKILTNENRELSNLIKQHEINAEEKDIIVTDLLRK